MSAKSIHLTRLTLTGPEVADAEVRFELGLNVVVGASDTGKTFIVQCIDFMLGAGRAPKEIPEAFSYDTVFLGIYCEAAPGELVLERSLKGGDFRLYREGEEVVVLAGKHQAGNEETISHFLLNASGLTGKKVRTNQQGKTRPLSFRDIAQLILVDETTVISERSPIFSGHRTSKTAESSVFRFLLTGIDDSSVIAKENPKIAKGRREGKSEVIEAMLQTARAQVVDFKVEGETAELCEQLTHLDTLFEESSQALAAQQKSAVQLEGTRQKAWGRLRQVDSRLGVLSQLQIRFELLEEQYKSDLRRLETISEAGYRLGQMKEEHCPVCGSSAEHHNARHQSPIVSPENVASSSNAEANKISSLLTGLHRTLQANQKEVNCLKDEQLVERESLEKASARLQEGLQPRIQDALQKFRDSQSQRAKVRQAIELRRRVQELEELFGGIEKAPKRERAEGPATSVGADVAEGFSQEVEALLQSWHFPNLERVTFSEEDQDVVISGQRRGSHGKGVRAITHAAFNLALLKYCKSTSKPHPGFALVDSPLIVYRQPDVGEDDFSLNVKVGFYRSLASDFLQAQVIIFENDAPPDDLRDEINHIEFTGAGHGRRGFIPNTD